MKPVHVDEKFTRAELYDAMYLWNKEQRLNPRDFTPDQSLHTMNISDDVAVRVDSLINYINKAKENRKHNENTKCIPYTATVILKEVKRKKRK